MDCSSILRILRVLEPELKAAGVVHLRLFGSTVRGENRTNSDVDVMVDIDRAKHITLLGLVRIEDRLSEVLGVKVDLALADSLRETVRKRALQEAVLAF